MRTAGGWRCPPPVDHLNDCGAGDASSGHGDVSRPGSCKPVVSPRAEIQPGLFLAQPWSWGFLVDPPGGPQGVALKWTPQAEQRLGEQLLARARPRPGIF
jgi:hypothetical protein